MAKIPTAAVLRAQAIGEMQGFMRILVGAKDDRILGFTMIGSEAGEVMAAVQTAMLAGMPYSALRDAILAHPTMAEGLGFLLANAPQVARQAVPHRASAGGIRQGSLPRRVLRARSCQRAALERGWRAEKRKTMVSALSEERRPPLGAPTSAQVAER